MSVIVGSETTLSIGANEKSSSQVSGNFEFVDPGNINFAVLSSVTGLNATLSVGGVVLMDDMPIGFFGTTGGLRNLDNTMLNQAVLGGRISLIFRNTTGDAITVDYILSFEPTGKRR